MTNFFRDPPAWEVLRDKVLPACSPSARRAECSAPGLRAAPPARRPTPSPWCFKEALEKLRPSGELLPANLRHRPGPHAQSRRPAQGVYPANIASDLSSQRLRRFFVKEDSGLPGAQGDPRDGGPGARKTSSRTRHSPGSTSSAAATSSSTWSGELQQQLMPLFHYSPQPRRRPVPGQRRDHRAAHRACSPRSTRKLASTGGWSRAQAARSR